MIDEPLQKINTEWYRKKMDDRVFCLYNPLSFDVIFTREQEKEHDSISQSIEVDSSMLRRRQKGMLQRTINTLYIIPTFRCNNACGYCDLRNIPSHVVQKDMTEGTLCESLNRFFKLSEKQSEKEIVIFGGEPLLDSDIMMNIIRSIREDHDSRANITIFTNAMLMTKDIASYFAERDVFVITSIDGMRENHDAARKDINGRGTFDRAAKGYFLARDAGCKVGISMQVGKHNVRNLHDTVLAMYDFFRPMEFGIGCNFHNFKGERNPYQLDAMSAMPAILDIYDNLKEMGIYVEQVVRRVRPFVERNFKGKDCTACGRKIVAIPDGRLGLCEYLAYEGLTYQPIETFSLETDDYNTFNSLSPLLKKDCLNCPAISICGGGCAYNARFDTGSIHGLDIENCRQTIIILDWMLEKMFQVCRDEIERNGRHLLQDEERKKLVGKINLDDKRRPLNLVSRVGEIDD
jgi:radical SAM protein with 4Fe4S-binding SPASM domain